MKPAARLSDTTGHGGMVATGAATVFIEALPAARIADVVACPSHGGGVVIGPGASMVFIEGLNAARMLDQAGCPVGPSPIMMGAGMVFIGD